MGGKKEAFVYLKGEKDLPPYRSVTSGVYFLTPLFLLTFLLCADPELAWLPAKLKRSSGNVADVQIPQYADEQSTVCDGGKKAKNWIEAEVDLSDYNKGVLPMQNVDENGNLRKFADMVELPFLHEVRAFGLVDGLGCMVQWR